MLGTHGTALAVFYADLEEYDFLSQLQIHIPHQSTRHVREAIR